MLRAAQLLDQLEAALSPSGVTRQAQTADDETVDLFPEQHLGQHELLLCGEHLDRFVADAKQYAAGQRILVAVNLLLDVQLVLVFERARRSLGHAGEIGVENAARKLLS